MGRLDDKVALITGGARGQGAEEAKLFASEGAQVVITDVLDDDGKRTAAGIGSAATFHHHDVTSEAEWTSVVDAVLAEHGRLDVLVNNAGIFQVLPLLMTSEADYRKVIDVNQIGVFLGMKAVLPHMVERQRGSVINISSVAGLIGSPGTFAYSASKWAVRGMTRSAAKEVAPFGVRVNSIHPGIIDTAMIDQLEDLGVMPVVMERIPAGRKADAVEVARLALYLASDDSVYSNGSEFIVDGGMTA
ncbi:MAG TPA: glucose 1-dehydrogenase [Acidimicrobiales bacterium]|jgi:3alpha(or 20beta)-hydroxysteroid dehydrogenase|nr:glucose 1-dehydrogenase [Acidimicrobiales bacterium]